MVPAIVRTDPDRFQRLLAQPRVRGQAQVVVRREVDDLPVIERAGVALFTFQNAKVAVESLLAERVELVRQVIERVGAHAAQYSEALEAAERQFTVKNTAVHGTIATAK